VRGDLEADRSSGSPGSPPRPVPLPSWRRHRCVTQHVRGRPGHSNGRSYRRGGRPGRCSLLLSRLTGAASSSAATGSPPGTGGRMAHDQLPSRPRASHGPSPVPAHCLVSRRTQPRSRPRRPWQPPCPGSSLSSITARRAEGGCPSGAASPAARMSWSGEMISPRPVPR
jgi:hypothetical protein